MAASVLCQQYALNTSTGTQDFTISGAGTCKGVLVIGGLATVNGTEIDHAGGVWGFIGTDGTERSICGASEHDQTNTDTYRYADTGVIRGLTGTGGTDYVISWDSYITDGVRLSIDTAPSSARLVSLVMFFGADVNVEVGSLTMATGDDSEALVTVSQQTHLLFTATTNDSTLDSANAHMSMHMGVATTSDAGTTIQTGGCAFNPPDNQAASNVRMSMGARVGFNYGSDINRAYEVTTLSSTQVGKIRS